MRADPDRAPAFGGGVALAIAPGVLLAGFAGGIAFPILPIVGQRAGLALPFIGLILAGNRIARVVAAPLVGWITDRVGGRRTVLAGLVIQIAVIALYAAGVATNRPGPFFLAGRLLHGPGSACVFVAGQALALNGSSTSERGRAAATVRAAIGLGVPVGLAVGGLLADALGPLRTFQACVVVLLVSTVAAYFTVPDLRVPAGEDIALREKLRALANGRMAVIGLLNLAGTFCASGLVLTTTVLIVRERHFALLGRGVQGTAGLALGWMVVVDAAVMFAAGRAGDLRRNHATIAAVGITTLIPGLVGVAYARTVLELLVGLAIVGAGSGALGPSLLALVGERGRAASRGLDVGALQLAGDVGGALGPLFGTALFAGTSASPYLAAAAMMVCIVPFALWLARRAA